MLTKSTPEGARDYLVPSRVHPGVLCLAAVTADLQADPDDLGLDRYFQIVKCFRDEDLRADRQPEFTQVDLEISFATEDLVFSTIEPLMGRLMGLIGREAPRPFRRMPYAEAIAPTASTSRTCAPGWNCRTSPDRLRRQSSRCFGTSSRRAEKSAASSKARAREDLDDLTEQAKQLGASGLVWARNADGAIQSSA